MWQQVTSPRNPRFRAALRLHQSRGRRQQSRILVFGLRELVRARAAGLAVEEIFFCDEGLGEHGRSVLQSILAASGSARVMELSPALFSRLAYGDRQGAVAVAARPPSGLDRLKPDGIPLVVVLDSVEKPGNIGAVVRSADGAGSTAVIVADPLADLFHPNAIRSSVATVFSVPVAQAPRGEVRSWLETNGYRILLAEDSAAVPLFQCRLDGRVAVVLGNEAHGLGEEWRSGTNSAGLRIPMQGIADSLNVSVAGAVVIYESLRQRQFAT